ncbi:MAG: ROK family protein [Tagaea sp.]
MTGADLGGTKLRIVRFEGRLAHVREIPTGPAFGRAALARALAGIDGTFGLAVPGLVSRRRIVACDVLPGIAGAGFPRAAALLNDARAAAVAELEDLPRGGTAAIVMIGTAIGAALIADGRILDGAHGFAGELGYLPMGDGTLDEAAGGAAILRRAKCDAPTLKLRLLAGDAVAHAGVVRAGAALGAGLAALANLIDPERITLGGGTLLWPGYIAAAKTEFRRRTLAPIAKRCLLRRTPWGANVVARGAALAAR